jgi:hypothetical protein
MWRFTRQRIGGAVGEKHRAQFTGLGLALCAWLLLSACTARQPISTYVHADSSGISAVRTVRIVSDVCILRDVAIGDDYWSIKESQAAADLMRDAAAKALAEKGFGSQWNISVLDTYVALVDVKTGRIIWANSLRLKDGNPAAAVEPLEEERLDEGAIGRVLLDQVDDGCCVDAEQCLQADRAAISSLPFVSEAVHVLLGVFPFPDLLA